MQSAQPINHVGLIHPCLILNDRISEVLHTLDFAALAASNLHGQGRQRQLLSTPATWMAGQYNSRHWRQSPDIQTNQRNGYLCLNNNIRHAFQA